MKIIQMISLLAVTCGLCFSKASTSQQHDGSKSPSTLEITANVQEGHSERWDFANTSERVVSTGSMVVVAIRKVNHSNQEIAKLYQGGGRSGYQFEVRDSSGTLVRPRRTGEQNGPIVIGGLGQLRSPGERNLKPGEGHVMNAPISNWFDMSRPGKYTVQVWGPHFE